VLGIEEGGEFRALQPQRIDTGAVICPMCGGQMRIIAFITFSSDIHKILIHIGVNPEAPQITPARGPPLWDDRGAQEPGEGVDAEPNWNMASQSTPDYPDDQHTTW